MRVLQIWLLILNLKINVYKLRIRKLIQKRLHICASVASILALVIILASLMFYSPNTYNIFRKLKVGTDKPVSVRNKKFRTTPRLDLSEDEVIAFIFKNNVYNKGHGGDPWQNIEGDDFKNRYVLQNNDKVVFDSASGLMWQREGTRGLPIYYTDSQKYIDKFNNQKYAGYSDWRLPTLEEAMTLIEKNANSSELYIDEMFGYEQIGIWTCDMKDANHVWVVYFNQAGIGSVDLKFSATIRAVR